MYRSILLYHTLPPASDVALVLAAGTALILVGSAVFNKLERRFAEEL